MGRNVVKSEQASKGLMWMPTRLENGEGRASGGAIDMPPLDPPGYWARHVGRVVRVIGGDPRGRGFGFEPIERMASRAGVGQGHSSVDAE